nr:MAG TPA: hypothetical protein [Caudoviricetes sp.]
MYADFRVQLYILYLSIYKKSKTTKTLVLVCRCTYICILCKEIFFEKENKVPCEEKQDTNISVLYKNVNIRQHEAILITNIQLNLHLLKVFQLD